MYSNNEFLTYFQVVILTFLVISAVSKPQIGFNGLGSSSFNNNLITQYNYGYQVGYLQNNIINVRARQPFQPHFQPHYQPQFLLHFQPSVLPTFPPYPFIPQIQPFIPQSRLFQPKTLNSWNLGKLSDPGTAENQFLNVIGIFWKVFGC